MKESGMLEEAHVFDSLPAYALGALDAAESRVVFSCLRPTPIDCAA